MSELDMTSLNALVLKLKYADDDAREGAAREVAKYLNHTNVGFDTLTGLVENGPLFDGDVPSKSERDVLLDVGLCVKVCVKGEDGFNAATNLAATVLRAWKELNVDAKLNETPTDTIIGATGPEPEPATESLVDDLQVELVWDAIGTQYHDLGKEAIRINTASILRYAELLSTTYCDGGWVKAQDPSLGELEIKKVVYDASMLQHHCWCLANLDIDRVNDGVVLQLITHARNLHDTLYDSVS